MDNLEIKIACKPMDDVSLSELNNIQGNLKTLTEEDYVKLRNSMTEYDFSFPFFIWIDETGKKWVTDGNQRNRVLLKMQEEGIKLPEKFPAYQVLADNKIQAKKKLLLLNSRYGKVTDTGMSDFLNEADSPIQFEEIADLLTFPEANFDAEDNQQGSGGQSKEVTCPSCGNKFEI